MRPDAHRYAVCVVNRAAGPCNVMYQLDGVFDVRTRGDVNVLVLVRVNIVIVWRRPRSSFCASLARPAACVANKSGPVAEVVIVGHKVSL